MIENWVRFFKLEWLNDWRKKKNRVYEKKKDLKLLNGLPF